MAFHFIQEHELRCDLGVQVQAPLKNGLEVSDPPTPCCLQVRLLTGAILSAYPKAPKPGKAEVTTAPLPSGMPPATEPQAPALPDTLAGWAE